MPRILYFLFTLLFLQQLCFAQTTYTWVGAPVGDYQTSTNWSPVRTAPLNNDILAFNATAVLTIANVPNQTIGALRIVSGTNTVTLTTNVSTNVLSLGAVNALVFSTAGSIYVGDLLTVSLINTGAFTIAAGTFGIAPSSGGKVVINSAITLSGGTLDFDVAGTGGTTVAASGSITYNSGVFNSSNVSAISWAGGSNYYHAANGAAASAIPVCFWLSGSTCTINGLNAGTTAPTGLTTNSFSNLTWNCASQAGNIDLDLYGAPINVAGNLTVTSTGANALRFTGTGTTTINAVGYNQTGGTLVLQASTGTTTLNVTGNFSHTVGGMIDFAGSGASIGTATLAVKGNLTKGTGTTWSSSSNNTASQMNIQFTGNTSQIVTIAGTWNNPGAGRCNIINNNADAVGVSLNSSGVSGSLRVTNIGSASPATCTNAGNFTGVGYVSYFGSGAGANNFTLIYNGSTTQTASSVEFPATGGPYNLTISSTVGVSFPSSVTPIFDRAIPGRFSMVSGNINIGNNTLSLTNASLATQLAYTSGFIASGSLSRRFPTSGLPTSAATANSKFPFGSGTNDRSINIFFSAANLTGGTGGDITISHTAIVNATALTPFNDNGSLLDKRTNSRWDFNTGAFDLGSAGTTISVTAQGNNIGSVDNVSTLRLTDAVAGFGTLIPSTGTVDAPLVGKSGLVIGDITGKTFYIGSDFVNALQIVTFTWTGSVSTAWTTAANWTGGVGYPASPTEVAIINTVSGNMPVIATGTAIQVYQLKVGPSASLTMNGTASISVYDTVTVTGTVSFASTSTFMYASSIIAQTVLDLAYGGLSFSGSAAKTLPATTTITGDLGITGATPAFGTGTFVYAAGATIQRVFATNYYNLTIAGNRGGNTIRLGNGVSNNSIEVANVFSITATNYSATYDSYNTFKFTSAGTQNVPGFWYGTVTSTTNGTRIYDALGSTDATHVIYCKAFTPYTPYDSSRNIMVGSKVVMNRTGGTGATALSGLKYHDFEVTGNLGGNSIYVQNNNTISIAGTFTFTGTNFTQPPINNTFNFNGTGSQIIPAFKTNTGTNTPAWKYYNVTVTNGNRVITLGGGGTDTIFVSGPTFTVPTVASFPGATGFTVAGSTVNFNTGSANIPVLKPASGLNNYNNIVVESGTHQLLGDLTLGGNLTVTGTDAAPAQMNIGNNTGPRILTILGNMTVNGTSASSALTSFVDFNAYAYATQIRLAGNLSISGSGQITTLIGTAPGSILFNGTAQQYSNTSTNKNGAVNFIAGDGTASTTLTLNTNLELFRSGAAPFSSSLTVATNSTLNAGTRNITIGTDDNNIGNNAAFNLNSNATFITANTGISPNFAIEGVATDGTTGTILAGTKITKLYDVGANYVLNGATVNPFPAAISTMANLTIGAAVSLNKAIVATGILDLASFTLTQANNNLQFSGLTSTTGNIYADKNSSLSISGSVGTVGTLRFATGGNITGQFTINRAVTIPLQSDLTIDATVVTGNFITGTSSSILDINGNTLTINGAISGPGTLSGSNTSNLSLGGAAGTVSFTSGKQVLKNLSLVNAATALLGTPLDITDGASLNNEGTVSVTGTALLTTGGNLTLKSGAFGTARVAPGATTGGYINGDVTVERYLPAVRAWRFLAAPTYGQTIKQAWQENQAAGVNPGTGYGTIITSSVAATWAANGFDFNTPGQSLLQYSAGAWVSVPSTTAPITTAGANKSYMLFSRGDRSITPAMGTGATPTPVLLRTKGSLFQGNQPAIAIATAGDFASVGNNYASVIDFTLLNKTNIDQVYSMWDPKVPGSQGLGAWVTFSAFTPTPWAPSIGGGSYTAGVGNTKIQSGQAFMVRTTPGSANIVINEASKLSGSNLVLRPSGTNSIKSYITTNLYNMSTGTANISDGNTVVFGEEFSNAVDEKDAVKPTNFGDNLGLLRGGLPLVVETREPVTESDTVFFFMRKLKVQPYRLGFTAANFDNTTIAFLEDKFLHTLTPVNLAGTTEADFSITSDVASAANDRFRIVFRGAVVLPVTFVNVTATKSNNGNAVEWKVENEINIRSYEVERATDGINFTKAGAVAANNSSSYNWLDAYPVSGDNFYRVKSIDNRGVVQYSRIVKVSSVKGKTGYTVYPNPSTDGSFGLQMSNVAAGIYTVKITNANGQLIWKELVNHSGGTATNIIHPSSQLGAGNYQLEVIDITGKSTVIKVMML